MHGSVSARPLQQMAPHLLVLISCCFAVQSVLSELVFSTRPVGGAAALGAPLTMHCAVFDPQQQRPLPVWWERAGGGGGGGGGGGEPLWAALHPPPGSVDVQVLANGTLFIPRLRHKHLGTYVCCAGEGARRISAAIQVEKAGLESVFFSPRTLTVMEGESAFLQCVSGDSSPPAHITWLKDRTLVITGRQIQGQYGGGAQKKTSGTLHLSNVTLKDEGIYVCVTLNPLLNISQESQAARLTVLAPRRLQITQGPENVTMALGTDASMCCTVRGLPAPTVHWFKDGAPLTNGSSSFRFQDNGQLLVFRNVSEKDEGSYHCVASNQRETLHSKTAFLLSAVTGWSLAQQPSNLTVKSGENATLVCRPPLSRPTARLSWFRNGRLLTPKDHLTVQPSGDLLFYSVQESDSGSYFCRASNGHLKRSVTSSKAFLTVLQAPPVVKLWPQVATVPMGAPVLLECQVWGRHPLSIRWFKQGSKKTGGKIAVGIRNATLYIPSARSYDEGTYICEASNVAGENHSAASLTVAVSPIILAHAWQVSVRIGALVTLPCRAVGVPPIAYTWTRDRGETHIVVVPSEDRHIDDDGALHFSSAQLSDAGQYYCTAENPAGRQQRPTVLTVTAEEDPTDTAKQTRLNLPATDDSERVSSEASASAVGERVGPAHYLHVETTPTYSIQSRFTSHRGLTANKPLIPSTLLKDRAMSRLHGPPDLQSQLPLDQTTTIPTEPIVAQMQPPLLQPLIMPYLEVQSTDRQSQQLTNAPFSIAKAQPPIAYSQPLPVIPTQYLLSQSKFQTAQTSSGTQIQHEINEPSTQATTHDATQTSGVPFQRLRSEPPTVSSLNKVPVQTPISQLSTSGSSEQSFSDLQNVATKPNPYRVGPRISSLDLAESPRAQHVFTVTQSSSARSPMPQSHPLRPSLPLAKLLPPSTSQSHQSPHVQTRPARDKGQPSQTPYQQPSATQPQLMFTTSALPPTWSSPTQYHRTEPKPPSQTVSWKLQNQPGTPLVLQSPRSTARPPDLTSGASTSSDGKDVEVPGTHRATTAGQTHPNVSQRARPSQQHESANDTEPTEWLKRNTSQSPMTSNDPKGRSPSWLPVLEKHDIPIVVGVGVSLAFILITMAFYSLVQKNEPAPTSRAGDQFTAQRNFGVPTRHAERLAIARTYDNRAFEDDECMAVIEQSPNTSDTRARPPDLSLVTVQSPNTSDTRARPPALSLVTVQMEPAVEDLLEEDLLQPALDDQLVAVETYPDPLLDTQMDPPSEGEVGCSLSQPSSIQLQCVEDWAANANRHSRSPSQEEALPPPPPSSSHSLPSSGGCPSSPSSPPPRPEGLRSSLTLRTGTESRGAAPIHHSLSVSRGSPPLLLSHHVSVGLTTVAVDVHFYPAAGAVGVSSSTHINSVSSTTSMTTGPPFTSSRANSQENEQSTPRMHRDK